MRVKIFRCSRALSTKLGGGTTRMSATSMVPPHTAGVTALICQRAVLFGQTVTPVRIGTAPLNSPASSYTFDGGRKGVLSASVALAP